MFKIYYFGCQSNFFCKLYSAKTFCFLCKICVAFNRENEQNTVQFMHLIGYCIHGYLSLQIGSIDQFREYLF